MRNFLLSLLVFGLIFGPGLTQAASPLRFNAVHDFGHIGIDFKIYHSYPIYNGGDKPVKILGIDVNCDCTTVSKSDSIIAPNDSVMVSVSFETKNYYGPTNKMFTVRTDDSLRPEIKFFYLSIVGQWFNGIKPAPLSLFFLSASKEKIVTIPNKFYDKITLKGVMIAHPYVDIEVILSEAAKNEHLKLIVTRGEELGSGTYRTSITLQISVTDDDQDVFLTLPVKIVSY